MFKKPVKVSAQNQLSGKDRKVIKSKISEALDNECVQKIFNTEQKIVCCKIQGAKMLIYNGQDYPLFVDGTGKNNFFPSLYVAMAYQPLIKTLIINEGVEAYIYNGANLMWPGVRNYQGLGDFSKDQTVGIRNSKGQLIAIGAMGVSRKDLTDTSGVAVYILHYLGDKLWEMGSKNIPQIVVPLKVQVKKQQPKIEQPKKQQPKKEEKGKQKVQQTKKLQQKGKKQQSAKENQNKKKQSSPKKQKTPQKSQSQSDGDDDFMNLVHSKNQPKGRVIKMQQKPKVKNAFLDDERQQKNAKGKKKQPAPQAQKGKQKGGRNKKQQSEQEDVMQQQEQVPTKKNQKNKKDDKKKGKQDKKQKGKKKQQSDEDQEQQTKKQGMRQDKSDGQEKQEKEQQKSAINSKLMDQYFKQSLLNAIKLTKIQQQLPIDSGRFFMDYMLLARPEGVKLEIKDSSYKKIGKFFEQMAKKKILQYKHPKDKKAQGAQIIKIFWQNEDIKNHVPTIKKMGSKEQQEKVESYSKAKLKLSKTVTLQAAYKPSQDLFNEVLKKPLNLMPAQGQKQVTDKQQIEYITEKQLREKIERYINKVTGADKEKKEQKEKQPKKVQKTLLIDYGKHEFLRQLLKKQIQEHQQNREKEQTLKAEEGSDDQQGQKKKKAKKGGNKQLLRVERHYLVQKLMKKAAPYYHVFDQASGLDIFKQGTFKGIQIIAEKANNKNVTRILGLELFITPKNEADDQIHGFAHQLQTKFACSVNVQNLPGKNAGKQIIVHGAFLDQLQEIFTEEHELPNKFITTQNKLDKKKKN